MRVPFDRWGLEQPLARILCDLEKTCLDCGEPATDHDFHKQVECQGTTWASGELRALLRLITPIVHEAERMEAACGSRDSLRRRIEEAHLYYQVGRFKPRCQCNEPAGKKGELGYIWARCPFCAEKSGKRAMALK